MAPAQPGPPAAETDVVIPTDSLERLRLKIEPAIERSIAAEVRVPGLVQPNAYNEVHVTPLVPGVVGRYL